MSNTDEPWVLEIEDGSDNPKYLKSKGKYIAFPTEDAAHAAVERYKESFPKEALENTYDPVQMYFDDDEYIHVEATYKIPKPRLSKKQKEKSADRTEGKLCPKCDGGGILLEYEHVKGGKCFACQGTGKKLSFAERNAVIKRSKESKPHSEAAYREYLANRESDQLDHRTTAPQENAKQIGFWSLIFIAIFLLIIIGQFNGS